MRMKEAQTLGILFLIAVGIIMLCMWGGGSPVAAPNTDNDLADLQPVVDDGPRVADVTPTRDEQQPIVPGGERPRVRQSRPWTERGADLPESGDPADIGMRADPETGADAPEPPRRPRYHVVAKGEVLTDISQHYYGTTRYWKKLVEANENLDPNRMSIGARIRIPYEDEITERAVPVTVEQTTPAPEASGSSNVALSASDARSYTVQKGDNLWKIAEREYGSGAHWKKIRDANLALLRGSDAVKPGMTLKIPTN